MFDITATAGAITRWTGLGVQLPEELSDAIALYEVIQWTEVGYQPTIDLTDLDAANVEDRLREFADELAISEAPAGGQSVLARAKHVALNTAARQVLGQARFAIPDDIDQMGESFAEHAEAYAAAVNVLPENLTAETLVAEGATAVAAYSTAQAEARYLNTISEWVYSTASITGALGRDAELTLRVLRPATPEQLVALDSAAYGQHDPTLAAIGAVYVAAVRNGVAFGINTLAEAAELRELLS